MMFQASEVTVVWTGLSAVDYVRLGKVRRGHPLGGCACVSALWAGAEILICRQGLNELVSNSLPYRGMETVFILRTTLLALTMG